MYYDDLLTDFLGEFGKYQIWIFLLLGLTAIPHAWNNMGIVFIAGVPDHWCASPQLGHLNLTDEVQKNLTIPLDAAGDFQKCYMYSRNYTDWTAEDVNNWLGTGANTVHNSTTKCAYGYSYSEDVYTNTIVSQWDLVCDKDVLASTTASIYAGGLMVGVLVSGIIADMIGRRPTLIITYVGMEIFSIASSFSPDVYTFSALRFFVGFFSMGIFTTAFVVAMEIVGPSFRVHTGVALEYFWAGGYVLYVLPAFFLRDWRTLQLVTGCIGLAVLPAFIVISESPRWLYIRRRKKQADTIVHKMAKVNKKTLPVPLDVSIVSEKKGYIWDLVRTPRLRMRTINCCFNWFVCSMVYYGLSLNTSNLGGNDYINFLISGAVEIPAYIFTQVALAYIGRRWPLAGTLILGGLALLATIPVPEELNWVIVTLSTFGKFCISASFAIIYVITAEMYATVTRQVAVSTGSMFARLGGIVAPYVAYSSKLGTWVPLVIFGACSLAAGGLALLFPETIGRKLPETVEEAEAFGLKQEEFGKVKGTDNVVFQVELAPNGNLNYPPEDSKTRL